MESECVMGLFDDFTDLLVLAYLLYGRGGTNQYGPRYWYSSLYAVVMLAAIGLDVIPKKICNYLVVLLVVVNILVFSYFSYLFQFNPRSCHCSHPDD